MRLTHFRLFLLFGGALLFLGPAIGLGQPGPGGFQPPPGGFQPRPGGFQPPPGGAQPGAQPPGAQRRQFDPSQLFNMVSGGKDYVTEADLLGSRFASRDPNLKDSVEAFMQRNGIANGMLTRDQFTQYMQERMAQRQNDRAANPNSQPPGAANNNASPSPDATTDDGEPPPPDDKRSVVYRAGNLPDGLPTWFATMDTDRDGQVGLYEWKAAGGSVSDFQTIDLNGDGFITIEEALRYQKAQTTVVAANGAPSFGPATPSFGTPSFGTPSFNGQPSNGFNRGNRGSNPGNRGNRGNRPGRQPGQ